MGKQIKNSLARKNEYPNFLYQYRPCSISENTIYDLENISNNVLFARSPIHMNDPFDSTIAFDEKELINEMIDLYFDNIQIEECIKLAIKSIIKNRIFNKFKIFVSDLNKINQSMKLICISQHWVMNNNFYSIYTKNEKKIYGRFGSEIKNKYSSSHIKGFLKLIDNLNGQLISDENILKIEGLGNLIADLENKLENFRNTEFKEKIEKLQKKIVVTCLSRKGWDNCLMWSHYTNSYQGICVEYDFSNFNISSGTLNQVKYYKNRPQIRLKDLNIKNPHFEKDETGKEIFLFDKPIKPNTENIVQHLFSKHNIWNYEEEWRIVSTVEKEDDIKLIPAPPIKSITYGININPICKCMIIDICNDKNINLYELIPSTKDYSLTRKLIDKDKTIISPEEQIKYIDFLQNNIISSFSVIEPIINELASSFRNNLFNSLIVIDFFKKCAKLLSETYFFKMAINRIYLKYPDMFSNMDMNSCKSSCENIDFSIDKLLVFSNDLNNNLNNFKNNGLINTSEFKSLLYQINGIEVIYNKLSKVKWLDK